MRFSPEFIEKVRDANNIVDVFAEHTQLKRTGSRLMGLCPFPGHNEKTPSFSVSEDKQVYHCFGCNRSGNIFKALEELKGFNFRECVEYLAQKAGVPIPTESREDSHEQQAKTHRDKLYKINRVTAQFYKEQLARSASNHHARLYAQKRRLTSEIIDLFQIGYSPEAWDSLALKLKAIGAPLEMAAELGLVRKRKEGDGYFDFFRNRLMFPIFSHKGDCVGFGGRAFSEDDPPKYRNSSESAV
jgi:DNA primase